ncbi:MAG: hypothetical protein IH840_00460 [Candidatus Heimdallarchaeota archaeon]|nr:hypothetical protein [Candidatus Heimdallarchaeota archaeon]
MRITSTPESVSDGRPSLLAISETLLAMCISVYFISTMDSYLQISVAVATAPLLLLRTRGSTELTWRWAESIWDRPHGFRSSTATVLDDSNLSIPRKLGNLIPRILAFIFVIIFVRVFAIIAYALRHPLESLRAIPGNWARINLCLDSCHSPEPLPGVEVRSSPMARELRLGSFFLTSKRIYGSSRNIFYRIIITGGLLAVGGVVYLPAFVYRWSLKSTSVIYLPLLWIIGTSIWRGRELLQLCNDIVRSAFERLRQVYAVFVVIVLTLLPLLSWKHLRPLIESVQEYVGWEIVNIYLITNEIQTWHLARFVNACLTLSLWLFSDWYRRSVDMAKYPKWIKNSHTVARMRSTIDVALLIRGILGFYVLVCALYIFFRNIVWPQIDWTVFPW